MSSELLEVLAATRGLLARPDNDFSWSSWESLSVALKELDDLILEVRSGRVPRGTLDVLFAPTGPIQEVSLSSGWAADFLALAQRYDEAVANAARR